MKEPVNLGFLEFRTREQREAVCHAKSSSIGAWRLTCTWVSHMCSATTAGRASASSSSGRMPSDRRLSTLVARAVLRTRDRDHREAI